jgi:beta-galactosidase
MPTPEWVEACDRLGVMMMCETRQMSSNPEGLAQLEAMVKRYRNSPSIILWSIGNEEWHLQNDEAEQGAKSEPHGAPLPRTRSHPPRLRRGQRNNSAKASPKPSTSSASTTTSSFPTSYHKKHPKMPVYGSETSAPSARAASTPPIRCATLVNSLRRRRALGRNRRRVVEVLRHPRMARRRLRLDRLRLSRRTHALRLALHQLAVRHRRYVRLSQRHLLLLQSLVGPRNPVLHLFPHWNWEGREGEPIKIWVYSNLDEVELFVNGVSAGSQKVPHLGHVEWTAKYEPGMIEARGSKDGKVVLTEKRETTGEPATIKLTADRTEIDADGEDVAILRVEVLDKQGRPVPTAGI